MPKKATKDFGARSTRPVVRDQAVASGHPHFETGGVLQERMPDELRARSWHPESPSSPGNSAQGATVVAATFACALSER